ncbi:cytochrome P450 [Kibdelosporangium persicum]|uniref:Erythromycin C-12 hydroxylase n=1 Tax=Kibdelosporangium persicum TaxID=2698649 RepID=A0ABX2F9R1_9PSEU|nr:cytochrome P450 [Kibdelosporangium persicum]NRN67953.1 Erythromycin C-12 hydroxylase [Kibdelosporangium persicum]
MHDPRLDNDFDPLAAETFTSAHKLYQRMRAECPVAHSTAYGGFWALFRHEDVLRVLTDIDTFTTSVQNVVPKFAFTGRRPPLHFDPPEHTVYRRVINRSLTPRKVAALAPKVREHCVAVLQPLIDAGAGDVAADYAQVFPAHVFAEFFHVPLHLSARIKRISAEYVAAIQVVDDENVKRLSRVLYDIAADVIEARRADAWAPEDDLTTALLAETHEGEPLPPELVHGCVRQLLVTGMVAPSVFIGTMLAHLAGDKDLQRLLRAEPARIDAAVEEYLRLYTPYRGMSRTARRDVEIGGRLIRADEPIALVYTSANRDEAVFGDGEEFVLDRPALHRSIAFGAGIHSCPGAPLARLMLRTTVAELLARTTDFDVAGEIEMARWAEWGTHRVPMTFQPA